jgi:prefoldin subunit 5
MPEKSPAPDRVQSAFTHLSSVASELNSASDELVATISELNEALKALNLGISAWVELASGGDDGGNYWWTRDLGYAKLRNEWGIALRKVSGDTGNEQNEVKEEWTFAEAPRWMRIDAVSRIPDLLEKLTKEAEGAAKKIRKKTAEAKAITQAVREATEMAAFEGLDK